MLFLGFVPRRSHMAPAKFISLMNQRRSIAFQSVQPDICLDRLISFMPEWKVELNFTTYSLLSEEIQHIWVVIGNICNQSQALQNHYFTFLRTFSFWLSYVIEIIVLVPFSVYPHLSVYDEVVMFLTCYILFMDERHFMDSKNGFSIHWSINSRILGYFE